MKLNTSSQKILLQESNNLYKCTQHLCPAPRPVLQSNVCWCPSAPRSDVYHGVPSEGDIRGGSCPRGQCGACPAAVWCQRHLGVCSGCTFPRSTSETILHWPGPQHTEKTNPWPVTDDTQLSARGTTPPLPCGQQGHCRSSLDYLVPNHISICVSLSLKRTHVSPETRGSWWNW